MKLPSLTPAVMAALLFWTTVPYFAYGAEVRGEIEDPNKAFGRDAHYQLVGNCSFGWRSGTVAGDIDLNGHALVVETGGGNRTVFSGAISGEGSVVWRGGAVPQVGPSILSGDRPNTFRGIFTLGKGVLDLNKTGGTDAIPGDLLIGAEGSASIRLLKPDQINDAATVTFAGKEVAALELQGHSERFASLILQTHAEIHMGEAPAGLEVGNSSSGRWDLTKTLTILGFKPGKDRVRFGEDKRGLSKEQLSRIGFASPAGLPEGLYSARIADDGGLEPDSQIQAHHPPFDLSAQATSEREKLYTVGGLDRLKGTIRMLPEGATLSFFGDSLTWQNGIVTTIERSLQRGEDTHGKSIRLLNRGINGGGVLQVRDGVAEGAFPGKSAQKSFAEVIASDKSALAVVFIGINDVWWRNTAPEVFETALRDLTVAARANRTALVLVTLALRGELPNGGNSDDPKIERFAEITRRVARETDVTLVDARQAVIAYLQNHNSQLRVDRTLFFKTAGVLTYDGVHPSSRGVSLFAELISDGISRALLAPQKPRSSAAVRGIPGTRFDYSKQAFQPAAWARRGLSLQLVPWAGEQVVFLTTDMLLDPALMETWVTQLDAGWRVYADLTGRKPEPLNQIDGRASIAAVPGADLTCGAGCGYIGATGIELALFYDSIYPALKTHPHSVPPHVFYEMGRNYYTFGNRHSCFTTGFAVFMSHVCMDVIGCEDLEIRTRDTIERVERSFAASKWGFLDLFTASSGVGEKVHRIRDSQGKPVEPSDQPVCYASAMLRLRRENGGEAWVKRFYKELSECPGFPADTREGAMQQSWYWMLCASVAARKDLSPVFAGEWKLPIGDETRALLAQINWVQPGLKVSDVASKITPRWMTDSPVSQAPAGKKQLSLIPQPRKVSGTPGVLPITDSSRILATARELAPLTEVLAEEIFLTTGVRLATGVGLPVPGDIVLGIDGGMKDETHRLIVGETVTATGGSYAAVAAATATLLQLFEIRDGTLAVPRVQIEDEPAYAYRGVLLDVARKYHTPGSIEQVIELCRFYKIRHLHLHLTDDQLFMFPSTRFPQLGRSNLEFARFEPGSGVPVAPYSLDQLRALERFARDRGVYIVPEIDLPGHSGRLIADAPDVFGTQHNASTVNIASPRTLDALATLLNEVMDVFESSPYIHVGADEVGLEGLEKTAEYVEARARFGIQSVHDLYCKFVTDLHAVVARRGKKMIVWEEAWNPGGPFPLPRDALVMVWSQGKRPDDIAKSGYGIINASWTPLYIVRQNRKPPEFLYDWSPPHFGREGSSRYTTLQDTRGLLGAQLCSWENSECMEIQSMRQRLPVVAERSWTTHAERDFSAFQTRLTRLDGVLDKLLNAISVEADGKFADGENTFHEPFRLALKARKPGLTVKYTLDNSLPSGRWEVYEKPFLVERTAYLRAGLFDSRGQQEGRLVGGWFRSEILSRPNLATGKKVTVGPALDRSDRWSAKNAVDGRLEDPSGHWASEGPAPQWLQVDLGKVDPVNFINLVTYWDGVRHYQWNAEVSVDGTHWEKVVDFSNNVSPATARGYSATFPTAEARFVRVNLLKNSANPFVHIVELVVEHQDR